VGGFWVDKTPSVGVTEAGNQSMVGVGCGVSVARIGMGVAFNASNMAQELVINVSAKRHSTLEKKRALCFNNVTGI
jgi:hypothetical protein